MFVKILSLLVWCNLPYCCYNTDPWLWKLETASIAIFLYLGRYFEFQTISKDMSLIKGNIGCASCINFIFKSDGLLVKYSNFSLEPLFTSCTRFFAFLRKGNIFRSFMRI